MNLAKLAYESEKYANIFKNILRSNNVIIIYISLNSIASCCHSRILILSWLYRADLSVIDQ